MDDEALGPQRPGELAHDDRPGPALHRGLGPPGAARPPDPAGGRVSEELPQQLGAAGLELVGVEVSGDDRGDDCHPAARPGDRDVEPALAALDVERSEAVEHPAVRGLAIADREDDGVPLVALDAVEVLDEERLRAALVEELGDLVGHDRQGTAQGAPR